MVMFAGELAACVRVLDITAAEYPHTYYASTRQINQPFSRHDTITITNAGLMMAHRLRRWPIINLASVTCLVFPGVLQEY